MRGQLLIPLLILQILKTFAIKPGNFIEWREKLSFFPGNELPKCQEKCHEKCTAYKGVAICSSFLESIDPEIIMDANSTNSKQV